MTLIQQGRRYGRAGKLSDWMPDSDRMMRAVRERPEALLVIAAGLALLFRGGARGMGRGMNRGMQRRRGMSTGMSAGMGASLNESMTEGWGAAASSARDMSEGAAESIREGAESMARSASDLAGDIAGRVSDTASEYASAATRWTEEAGETLAAQARSLPGELDEAVRDHPLVLAALGVAVGAALGASLPASRFENRTFGSARDQLGEAAEGVSGRFTEAAEEALDVVKRGAERRGFSGDSMRDVAREAAGAFASTALGADERSSGPGKNPQNSGSGGQGQGGRRNV